MSATWSRMIYGDYASLQAEAEALRAEVARKEALLETALGTVEAGNMFREAMCNEMRAAGCKVVATPDTIEVRNTRAERLAEALRECIDNREGLAYESEILDRARALLREQEEGHEQ
jgi:hypothetical protein